MAGVQDSNLRMAIPKTAALPLGYTPARSHKLVQKKEKFKAKFRIFSLSIAHAHLSWFVTLKNDF